MIGSFTTKGKAAVDRWRGHAGRRVGLLRLRMVRPFPAADVVEALAGKRAVGVIDQNLSPGLGGILFQEVAGALANVPDRPILKSFIGGLGGKDISEAEFDHVLAVLDRSRPHDGLTQAELLFTSAEWEQTRNRLALAGKSLNKESP
jgi:pyruvate ferredoxin oxidoreductase alpha subunit